MLALVHDSTAMAHSQVADQGARTHEAAPIVHWRVLRFVLKEHLAGEVVNGGNDGGAVSLTLRAPLRVIEVANTTAVAAVERN